MKTQTKLWLACAAAVFLGAAVGPLLGRGFHEARLRGGPLAAEEAARAARQREEEEALRVRLDGLRREIEELQRRNAAMRAAAASPDGPSAEEMRALLQKLVEIEKEDPAPGTPPEDPTARLARRFRDGEIPAPWDELADGVAWGARFARMAEGPSLDGPTLAQRRATSDGASVAFPAGRFGFDPRDMLSGERPPRELVVQGAGIDATLVVLAADLGARRAPLRLEFRDLTLDTAARDLLPALPAGSTVRMERCRAVGFDGSRGERCVLFRGGVALHLVRCRVEASYGGGPGRSVLFVGDGLLASVEDSVLSGPFGALTSGKRQAIRFARCRFEEMDPGLEDRIEFDDEGRTAGSMPGVRFSDCSFTFLAMDNHGSEMRRHLRDLNPTWFPEDAKGR